jgi:hypothetical protein
MHTYQNFRLVTDNKRDYIRGSGKEYQIGVLTMLGQTQQRAIDLARAAGHLAYSTTGGFVIVEIDYRHSGQSHTETHRCRTLRDVKKLLASEADIALSPLAVGLVQLVSESKRIYGEPLHWEQIGCYLDPSRRTEAHGMLDDLEARCGFDVVYARWAIS